MSTNHTEIANEVANKTKKFIEEWMKEFQARVTAKTPVLTGHLKEGWRTDITPTDATLSNTEDYAIYVELGTVHMAPRAMVHTTMMENEQITQIAKDKAGL